MNSTRILPQKPAAAKVLVVALAILTALLFASCTTTQDPYSSQEECDYALHYMLEKANENTISKLFFRITAAQTFLPDDLGFIAQSADSIPGLPKLLDEWTEYIGEYTMDWFEGFTVYVTSLAKDIHFDDPQSMVLESDYSAAQTMESVYKESVLSYVKTTLAGADLTKWNEVAVQYNAWTKTRKALYGEENPALGDVDLVDDMASYICRLYFDDLKSAETLLRTTPDPQADPIVAKVFGLD